MTNESEATRILTADRTPDLGPGTVLRGRYRLEQEIGRGGMGIVYRARDLELLRDVALKVVLQAGSEDARRRLLREARAAASLNHPNIVAVFDVGEELGLPFFVMEFVQGRSLRGDEALDLQRLVEIACRICDALEHAHASGVVHRDLKPDNILVTDTGHVKIADLGLALPGPDARISRSGMVVGTAAYMAPEQALGKAVDGRADLYALGVILYELATGRLPFVGDGPLAVVSQHVHASVVPPSVLRPDLPRALERVILRLLEKSPGARFPSAAETAVALKASLSSQSGADHVSTGAVLGALSRGRLVGRDAELAEIKEIWDGARRHASGHAVLLSGEPGAGKTRLAREIVVQALVDGAVVLTGGCYEYEATTPYLPFVEAFRRWLREHDDIAYVRDILGDNASQIAKLVPELEGRIGPFPPRPELLPHEERLLFFDAVVKVFSALAGSSGLLFYADDLHWADSSTLWLTGHLLRQLRGERVLVVGAYREIELDRSHPLAKALVDWNRERLVTRIALRRFELDQTSTQLEALLGQPVSADFGELVHRETEGNPFFVEEVLKALVEAGSVRRESGVWKRNEVDELVIPQSVKEAIGSRLDRIRPDTNEVLRGAAVLGKTFTFGSLAAMFGDRTEDALLDSLDEAVLAQIVSASGGDTYAFTHDKIREVLYEELNPIRRRRFHRMAAECFESSSKDIHATAADGGGASGGIRGADEKLAYHFIEAGDYERALPYAKSAANEAERIFAYDEAIAAHTRALECATTLGLAAEQLVEEEAIGKVYLLQGDMIPAGRHFERAIALTDDARVKARLQCEAASSLVTNGDERGIEYLREALKVLDPVAEPIETANALSIEGRFHHLAGDHQKAIELLGRATDLVAPAAAEAAGSLSSFAASIISQVYTYMAGAYQHNGQFDDSNVWARRSIEFGERHGVPIAEALGYEFLAENGFNTGDYEAGLGFAEHERRIVEKLHSRERRAWSHFAAAMCCHGLGDLERGQIEFRQGIELAEAAGEVRVGVLLKGNLSTLLADKATKHAHDDRVRATLFDDALQTAKDNFAVGERSGLLFMRVEAHRAMSHVHFRRGELAEAESFAAAAMEILAPTETRMVRLWVVPLYIEVLLERGRSLKRDGTLDEATSKFDLALQNLDEYRKLVAECQAQKFEREVQRLSKLATSIEPFDVP